MLQIYLYLLLHPVPDLFVADNFETPCFCMDCGSAWLVSWSDTHRAVLADWGIMSDRIVLQKSEGEVIPQTTQRLSPSLKEGSVKLSPSYLKLISVLLCNICVGRHIWFRWIIGRYQIEIPTLLHHICQVTGLHQPQTCFHTKFNSAYI